jgi:hypothetical protein
MPRYAITEKAGRFVAGQTNTGAGTVLTLTAKQAEHEVRLGTLQPLDITPGSQDRKMTSTGKSDKQQKAPKQPKAPTDQS